MKKSRAIILILAILIVASLVYLFTRDSIPNKLTGNAVYSHPVTLNCTNASITSKWAAIFQEPSTNLKIIVNESNNCSEFRAFKNKSNQFFILTGYSLPINETNISFSSSQLYAFRGNVSSDMATNFSSILLNESVPGVWLLFAITFVPYENITAITSSLGADTGFRSAFKITIPSYETRQQEGGTYYAFYENATVYKSSTIDLQEGSAAMVSANVSFMMFGYENATIASCSPIWKPINVTCNETTNNLTVWFNDSNNCKAFFPAVTYTAPANLTLSCFSPSAFLQGNQDSVTKVNIANLSLYINNILLNESQVYRENLSLEFKENTTSLVRLTYNFSQGLNLSTVRIEKQNSTTLFGYLIISGLDVPKTVYLDKLDANSNAVCIKDASVASISEISSACNLSSEKIVLCPGSNSSYNCSLSGSKLSVSGVAHSAIKEISQTSPSPQNLVCVANWNCTGWSACMNGNQIRTCTDTNTCNNVTGKPLELQTCTPPCTPNWACGNWSVCSKNGNQTRTCTDTSNCGIIQSKPSELQTCTPPKASKASSLLPKIIIGVVVFIILVVIVLLVIYLISSNNKRRDDPNLPSSRLGPVTPPSVDVSNSVQS